MRKFVFKFETLLKFRKSQRDLCLQQVAQVLDADQSMQVEHASLEQNRLEQLDQIRKLGQAGELDVDRTVSRRLYSVQLSSEIRLVEHKRHELARLLEGSRQALVKADQKVKVLEKLNEKQWAEFLYAQERKTARELDEVWLATHAGEYAK